MPTIEQRVVEMRFDNQQFEKGAKESIGTIEKLNKSLDFDEAGKNLNKLSEAGNKFSLKGMEVALSSITQKFSALEIAGITAIQNLTTRGMALSERFLKSVSVDQVAAGWSKYADKTSAVQTIMSATAKDWDDTGKQMEYVNSQIEKLNWFTDETSYSLLDMTSNIGKFTSNGIKLEDATKQMEGISVWASLSGASISDAGRAMYNLSQAMASGTVKSIDWMSIENANMATREFKEAAIEAAVAQGALIKTQNGYVTAAGKAVDVTNDFKGTLSTGWFNKDVLAATLNKFGSFTEALHEFIDDADLDTASEAIDMIEKYAEGNLNLDEVAKDTGLTVDELKKKLDVLSSSEMELGRRSFKAAQEAKTFQEAMESVKEAVGSGWMNTFELIFGNYQEAKGLWTKVANELYDVFATGGNERNEILKKWHNSEVGGYKDLMEGLNNLWEGIKNITAPIADAFSAIFDPFYDSDNGLEEKAKVLQNITVRFKEWTSNFAGYIRNFTEPIKEVTKDVEPVVQTLSETAQKIKRTKEVLDELAWQTINGDFGNDQTRVDTLNELGYSYELVQNRVNELLTEMGRGNYDFRYEIDETELLAETVNDVAEAAENLGDKSKAIEIFSNVLDKSSNFGFADYIALENAGYATEEFRKKLVDAAVAQGTLIKTEEGYTTASGEAVDITNYFKSSLSKGWATPEVLKEVLYSMDEFAPTFDPAIRRAESLRAGFVSLFSIAKFVLEVFKGITKVVGHTFVKVLTTIEPLIWGIINGFSDMIEVIREWFYPTETVAQIFDNLIEIIDAVIDKFAEFGRKVWKSAGFEKLGQSLSKLRDAVLGLFQNLSIRVGELPWADTLSKVLDILGEALSWIADKVSLFVDYISGHISTVRDFFGQFHFDEEKFAKITDALGDLYDKIKLFGGDILGIASEKVTELFNALTGKGPKEFMTQLFSPESAQEAIGKIKEAWKGAFGKAGEIGGKIKGDFKELANGEKVIGQLQDTWNDAFGKVGSYAKLGFFFASLQTQYYVRKTRRNFDETFNQMGEGFENAKDQARDFADNASENISNAYHGVTHLIIEQGLGVAKTALQNEKFRSVMEKIAKILPVHKLAFHALNKAFFRTGETSKTTAEKFRELGEKIKTAFGKENLAKIFEDVKAKVSNAEGFFAKAVEVIKGLWAGLMEEIRFQMHDPESALHGFLEKVKEFMGGIWDTITKFDPEKAGGLLKNTGVVGVLLMIVNFVKNITKATDGFSKVPEKIVGVLNGIIKDLDASANEKNANALLTLAKAIGIFALALIGLSLVNPDNLASVAGALIPIMGMIALIMAIIAKMKAAKADAEPKKTIADRLMAPIEGFIDGVKSTIDKFSKTIGLAAVLLSLAIAVGIIAKIANTIAEIPWAKFYSGAFRLTVIGGLLVGGAILLAKFAKKLTASTGKAILRIAKGLRILAQAVSILGEMEFSKAAVGVGALGLIMLGLGAFIEMIDGKDIGEAGTSILAMAAALTLLIIPVSVFALIPWKRLLQGVVAVGALLTILALAGTALSKNEKASTQMLKMAGALILISAPLVIVGALAKTAAIGLLILVGAMGAVLVGAAIAQTFTLGLELISNSMLKVGLGAALFGAAAALIAGAIYIVIAAFPKLIEGIVVLGDTILHKGAEFITGLGVLLAGIALAVIAAAPAIGAAITALVSSLGASLVAALPIFSSHALIFILGLLAFAWGAAPDVINSLLDLVVRVINSLADGLRNHAAPLFEALANVIDAIIDMLIEAVASIVELIPGVGDDWANKIREAKDWVIIEAQDLSEEVSEAASDVSADGARENMQQSIDEEISGVDATSAAEEKGQEGIMGFVNGFLHGKGDIGPEMLSGLTDIMSEDQLLQMMKDSGVENAEEMLSSLTGTVTDGADDVGVAVADMADGATAASKDEVTTSGESTGDNYVTGVASGIYNNAYKVDNAATYVAGRIPDKSNARLEIKSPSRVAMKIGRFFDLGLAKGLIDNTDEVENGAATAGDTMIEAINSVIGKVSNILSDDLDMTPTITPVVNLDDFEYGMDQIDSMTNARSIDIAGKIGKVVDPRQQLLDKLNMIDGSMMAINGSLATAGDASLTVNVPLYMNAKEVGHATASIVNDDINKMQRNAMRRAGNR